MASQQTTSTTGVHYPPVPMQIFCYCQKPAAYFTCKQGTHVNKNFYTCHEKKCQFFIWEESLPAHALGVKVDKLIALIEQNPKLTEALSKINPVTPNKSAPRKRNASNENGTSTPNSKKKKQSEKSSSNNPPTSPLPPPVSDYEELLS